jgi:hypothetical protein
VVVPAAFQSRITRGNCCWAFLTAELVSNHTNTKEDAINETAKAQGGGVDPNHFSSNFYAMEAQTPFRVVARTGHFCFGFPEPQEAGGNPYSRMQREPLEIGAIYNCPRIHFVSGMVQKADDRSRVIIAYGFSDCVPRMVVVQMADMIRMLFAPEEVL